MLKLKRKLNQKKRNVSCGKINNYYIFPFLSPIFISIRDILLHQAKMKTTGLRKILQYELYDGIMHSSCILLYIIVRNRIGEEKENTLLDYKQPVNKQEKPNKFKIFFILLTIGFGLNIYISTKMFKKMIQYLK